MIEDILCKLIEYIKLNKGKTIGGFIGFSIAVLILIIGFFRTIFIVLCIYIGYFIGNKIDRKESIKELLDKIFSLNKKF